MIGRFGTVQWFITGVWCGAVGGTGGREGCHEESKKIVLVDPHRHNELEKQEGSLM